MTAYHYQDNQLFLDQVSINDMAEQVGTPFYCYSQRHIEQQYKAYRDNLSNMDALICYALKANSNQAVIKVLADLGAGADVVSGGELKRALTAGIPAQRIVYSGVAKRADEIAFALEAGILQFNVESINELQLINRIAVDMGRQAPVALRINPDVDAETHEKISTGKAENKFGIPILQAPDIYQQAAELAGITIQGVDMHIGSQLTRLGPFDTAFKLLLQLVRHLRAEGHPLTHLDIGGGLGITYQTDQPAPSIADYCHHVSQLLGDWEGTLIVEPGRSLVAESGLLISQVSYIKQGQERNFCILDAAMNDLLRPALYGAHHDILPVSVREGSDTYDMVGPVCETGDTFARNYKSSQLAEGDLVAFSCVGAYGAVMASSYNSRPLIPEVLVRDHEYQIIRQRPSIEDLINQDQLARWQ